MRLGPCLPGELAEPNSGVSSGDAYQMNAYASRYRCKRLALVYPASVDSPPGRINEFVLNTEERPTLEVIAIDVRELTFGSRIPAGIDGVSQVSNSAGSASKPINSGTPAARVHPTSS